MSLDRLARIVASPRWLAGWTVAGLGLRLLLVARQGGALAFHDERDYDAIARSLAAGRGYLLHDVPTAFRAPGEPLLATLPYAVFGPNALVVEVLHALLLCLLPLATLRIARLAGASPLAAGLAAAVAALHPGIAYASASLYPVALTTTALTCGIWLAAEAAERGGRWRAAGGGVALGLAALATPTFAPLGVVAAVALAWRRRAGLGALLGALALAVPGAWAVRNVVVLDHAGLGTHGGYNLALGANDRATPRSGNWIEPDPLDPRPAGEVARDQAYTEQAWAWIAEHPAAFAWLALGRALATFDSVGRPRTRGEHDGIAAVVAGWALLPWVVLGVLGLALARRTPVSWMAAAALLLVVLSSALTLAKPRFRFPCDPALAAFAGLAAERIRAALRRPLALTRVPEIQ